jgi:hypothetical protein
LLTLQNPSFRFFDITSLPVSITRLDTFTLKIWVRRQQWILLAEEEVKLRSLNITNSTHDVMYHLIDGVYTTDPTPDPAPSKLWPPLPTSSYNALMRLSTLDDSIQDALRTREQLTAQIESILHPPNSAPQAQESAALAAHFVSKERKLLKASIKRRAEIKASLEARRAAIAEGKIAQDHVQDDVTSARSKLEECKALLKATIESIHGQRRRICEELLQTFPIEPTTTPLLFTICDLPLPNSSFEESDEDVVSAALGHVALLVNHLQYYLAVPLPYPIIPYASRSIVQDTISILPDNQRAFPLYTKGTVRFRFDYAVFLLNKDIECLAESQGLRVIDIRHTLPNLKYLLYVCSAGNSQLPSRKAGGVRGLLAGRMTPIQSGRGSIDSNQGEEVRKALEVQAGPVFNRGSLRTSGLRENIRL